MLIIPKNYRNILGGVEQTEKAIKAVKDMFQVNLSAQLALLRVTAPMMVLSGQGLNDDLNGVERPVRFPVKSMNEAPAEVVHSLAKWKRLKLAELHTAPGRGIYTDMNALRPDEDLDNIHSIYVDQWDWEIGSICGGGRYDNLTGIFGLPDLSGVGISFGADRIYDVLTGLELFPAALEQSTKLLFAVMGADELRYVLPLAKALREAGVAVEVYPEATKLKKQFDYADKKAIPFISINGSSEIEAGTVNLKNLVSGEQKAFPATDINSILDFLS